MVSWNKQRAVKSKPTADTIGVTLPFGASAAARAICTSPTLARSALKQLIKPEDWPPVGCILQKKIDSWWISQSARFSPSFHINIYTQIYIYIYIYIIIYTYILLLYIYIHIIIYIYIVKYSEIYIYCEIYIYIL